MHIQNWTPIFLDKTSLEKPHYGETDAIDEGLIIINSFTK